MKHPLPSSRVSKRQIVVYLDASLDGNVRRFVAANDLTLQQFLAKAINCALEHQGAKPLLTPQKTRVFVRKQKAAAPRGETATATRSGRKCLAGWYERNEVDALVRYSAEVGIPIQTIAEIGLTRLLKRFAAPQS